MFKKKLLSKMISHFQLRYADNLWMAKISFICKIVGNIFNIPVLQLIGFLSVAVILFAIYHEFDIYVKVHMCLTTLGIALVTSEAIMIMGNKHLCGSLTNKENTWLHSALATLGLVLIVAGIIVIEDNKNMHNEAHNNSIHGITGILSMVFLIVSFFLGILSIITRYLIRRNILNLSVDYLKWYFLPHTIFGTLGYSIGMGSLCFGTGREELTTHINYEMRVIFVITTIIIAVWILICSFVMLCDILKDLVAMYEVYDASSQTDIELQNRENIDLTRNKENDNENNSINV